MPKPEPILAWHFLPDDKRLRYGERTEVEAGKTYKATGPLRLCKNGMHASIKALDALRYAPGAVVCRVEMGGKMIEDNDKLCSRSRRVLWMVDATRTLRLFAVWCARQALEGERAAGRGPDPRSWTVLDVVERWVDGLVEAKTLRVAKDAADAAAYASYAAASYAAAYVAHDASYAAAHDAATYAADAYAAASYGHADAASRTNAYLTEQLMALTPEGYRE